VIARTIEQGQVNSAGSPGAQEFKKTVRLGSNSQALYRLFGRDPHMVGMRRQIIDFCVHFSNFSITLWSSGTFAQFVGLSGDIRIDKAIVQRSEQPTGTGPVGVGRSIVLVERL
jgi:hypothetical protein